MKISIIGYTGFIGSYLIKKFSKNIKINKINLRKINIRKLNKNTIKKIFSSKIIINCAASLNPRNDDDFFLNDEYIALKDLLIQLTIDQGCFQAFNYEPAIYYLINKKSCTKYYNLWSIGSNYDQQKFVSEINYVNN